MKSVKAVVVGDGTVGKTALLIALTMRQFEQEYVPTIFDNYSCNLMYQKEPYQLNLWDTAGQEEYGAIRSLSYDMTDVFLVCFSLIDPISFQNVRTKWIPELQQKFGTPKILLIGNKLDLRQDPKILSKLSHAQLEPILPTHGLALIQKIRAHGYIECSAKTFEGLANVFDQILKVHLDPFANSQLNASKKSKCIIF